MSDNPLIAPVTSTRTDWTGSGIPESYLDVKKAVEEGSWVEASLGGVGLALETVGSVMDPFGSLFAAGIGWAMEYFEPLREMLEELTGKADVVMSHAATWNNMAAELFSVSEDLGTRLDSDLSEWSGDAHVAYQTLMGYNVDGIGGLGATAAAIGAATEAAGGLVQVTHDLVRDLIAELVGHVIVWAIEAIFVVTLPLIALQIIGAVVKWVGIIMGYGMALVQSLMNLKTLVCG